MSYLQKTFTLLLGFFLGFVSTVMAQDGTIFPLEGLIISPPLMFYSIMSDIILADRRQRGIPPPGCTLPPQK
jgi:hypothetical protein